MMQPTTTSPLPFWKFGLLLVLIASLMITIRSLPQLDFIAWLQSTGSVTEVRVLQFISDSITFFSLGISLAIGIIGEFKSEKKKSRLSFLYVGLSLALAGLISYIIKNIGLVPRPYEIDTRIVQWSVGGGFSFPSGHTTEAFAAATALTFLYPQWRVALPVFFWASLVAFSRIYLGVHYPFDILGGIAIGTTAAYTLQLLFRAKTKIFDQ
jgi:membrane-associated phospholipid phosphatase